jgi:type IV pilus assembly protein PilM
VILAAAYREPIDQFTAAFDAAEIQLDAIDVEAFALLRAVAPQVANADGERTAVVALALGHDRTTLAISDGRVCDFTRVLEWGGSRLDAALARELGVTTEEAAEVKLGLALNSDDPATARTRNTVKHELTTLARELVASLQFYQAQPDSLALSEILVTGGTTRMPGFVEELERLVRARVRPADPLTAVQADGNISARNDLASLTIAIGLGVER